MKEQLQVDNNDEQKQGEIIGALRSMSSRRYQTRTYLPAVTGATNR